jgi:hypothetical protein
MQQGYKLCGIQAKDEEYGIRYKKRSIWLQGACAGVDGCFLWDAGVVGRLEN